MQVSEDPMPQALLRVFFIRPLLLRLQLQRVQKHGRKQGVGSSGKAGVHQAQPAGRGRFFTRDRGILLLVCDAEQCTTCHLWKLRSSRFHLFSLHRSTPPQCLPLSCEPQRCIVQIVWMQWTALYACHVKAQSWGFTLVPC